MPPLEIAVWAVGALGLGGLAWAFFKSGSFAIRMAALGIFGVFYISVLAIGWASTEWFNATTIGVALIAFMAGRKSTTGTKPAAESAASASSEASEAPEPDAVSDPVAGPDETSQTAEIGPSDRPA